MEDVIEVMKLLCYEMMELQRTQQDPSAQVGPNSEVVWQLLQQQADILVVLLTAQTGQVRPRPTAGSHPHHAMLYLKNTLCLTCQLKIIIKKPGCERRHGCEAAGLLFPDARMLLFVSCRCSLPRLLPLQQALVTCSPCTRAPASEWYSAIFAATSQLR
jgi:hypothetical protein